MIRLALLLFAAILPGLAMGATTVVSRAVVANTNNVIVSHTNLTLNGTATVHAVKFSDGTVQTTAAVGLGDLAAIGATATNAQLLASNAVPADGYTFGDGPLYEFTNEYGTIISIGQGAVAALQFLGPGSSNANFIGYHIGNAAGLTNLLDVTNRVVAGGQGTASVTNAGGVAYVEVAEYNGWRWINPWAGSGTTLNSGGGIGYPMDSSAGPYTMYMAGGADGVGVAYPIPPSDTWTQITAQVMFRTHYGHLTNQTVRIGFMRPPYAVHYASYGATMVGMMTNTLTTNFPISANTPAFFILREGAADSDTGRVDIIRMLWRYGP